MARWVFPTPGETVTHCVVSTISHRPVPVVPLFGQTLTARRGYRSATGKQTFVYPLPDGTWGLIPAWMISRASVPTASWYRSRTSPLLSFWISSARCQSCCRAVPVPDSEPNPFLQERRFGVMRTPKARERQLELQWTEAMQWRDLLARSHSRPRTSHPVRSTAAGRRGRRTGGRP